MSKSTVDAKRYILIWLMGVSKHSQLSEFLQFYSMNNFWHLSHTDALLVLTSQSWQTNVCSHFYFVESNLCNTFEVLFPCNDLSSSKKNRNSLRMKVGLFSFQFVVHFHEYTANWAKCISYLQSNYLECYVHARSSSWANIWSLSIFVFFFFVITKN